MSNDQLYDVWWTAAPEGEQQMEDRHNRHWQKILDVILETDLSDCAVLDFGCNQGGFLHFLYSQRPFKSGLGVDLARKSIEVANSRKGDLPLTYVATATLSPYENQFDIAISSSVIYLIPDLQDHARQIKHALKPEGVYYATYTDYAGNPSLPKMRKEINRFGEGEMQEYTLDEIAMPFLEEGFAVGARLMPVTGYIPIQIPQRFFESVADRMLYEYTQAYMFRFVAP
jgi:SAM-dependent methyltransferase